MDGECSAADLRSLLDADQDVRIVDVRPPAAFERGHIPESENVPLATLTNEVDRLDGADHVVTVCAHGEASLRAARLIAAYEGIDGPVESLACGVDGWDGDVAMGDSRR